MRTMLCLVVLLMVSHATADRVAPSDSHCWTDLEADSPSSRCCMTSHIAALNPASSASLPRIARVIIIGTLAVALKEEPEAAGLAPSEAGLAPSEAAFF